MYTSEDGEYLVKLARKNIETYLKTKKEVKIDPKELLDKYKENAGIFVTLRKNIPDNTSNLRGCIGYPLPYYSLYEALIKASISSATGDPRFKPVTSKEMEDLIVEITILTPPQKIKVSSPDEYPKNIKIGEDGLIVRYGGYSGLLLPQVPVEWKWTEEEFLDHTCNKAGLPSNTWRKAEDIVIEKFQGIIFEEEEPKGKIIQKKIE
ncbi:MAG: TIGR00296 family protein [Candidatus Lokiarchaeota archaeon]|nr:TIGR00296 family protein [Candidatus Lokiarchaeota archaeon]